MNAGSTTTDLATETTSQSDEVQWCEVVRADAHSAEGKAAFDQLYSRHHDAVFGQAIASTGDRHLAEDLVAEVFAKMLRALSNGVGPTSSVLGYLLVSLRGEIIRTATVNAPVQTVEPETLHDLASRSTPDISEGVAERDQVLRAFAGLPSDARRLLWLVEVEQLSAHEAAEHTGTSAATLRVQLHRARGSLATLYLQQHVAMPAPDCEPTVDLLAGHVRSNLKQAERARVEGHLAGCDVCTEQVKRLQRLNSGLRGILGPVLLGGGVAGGVSLLAGHSTDAAHTSAASITQPKKDSSIARNVAVAAAVVSGVILVIAGVLFFIPEGETDQGQPPVTVAETEDSTDEMQSEQQLPVEHDIPSEISELDTRADELSPTPEPSLDPQASVPGDDTTPRWRLIS